MSRPDISLSPDEQAVFMRENRKAALATIDKEGFPHLVAMTYAVRDGAFYMTSYRKAQKVVNIARNPRVALMVEAGGAYAELRGIMIRGTGEIIDDPAAVNEVFAMLAEDSGRGRRTESVASAPKRVVLRVVPEKVVTWDHTKLGGRH